MAPIYDLLRSIGMDSWIDANERQIDDIAVYDKQQGDHAIVARKKKGMQERRRSQAFLVCKSLMATDVEARS
jgi:hypothetical protein